MTQTASSLNATPASLLQRLRAPGPRQPDWDRFVRLYTPMLFRWARRAGLGGPDAEDLVQDVLGALVEVLPRFDYDGRKSFRAWLYTVTVNRYRTLIRSQAVRARAEREVVARRPPRDGFTREDYRTELVGRALPLIQAEFDEKVWRAFELQAILDQAPAAVAAQLGMSVNAVYLAKSRVLKRLRKELEGLFD